MKNLVRNGGFERGTIDFWTAVLEKSFAVDVATPYKGTYAGKLVADGANEPSALPTDFLEMGIGETAFFECYLRASHVFPVELKGAYYDENLDYVGSVTYSIMNPGVGSYNQLLCTMSGMEGAKYVKPIIYMGDSTLDRYILIDNVLMYKFRPEDIVAREALLITKTNLAAAGSHYGNYFITVPFKEAEFKLYVDDCLGAAETLDVKIVSRGNFGAVEHDIATFVQVTASNDLQTIVINEGIGPQVRVIAVVGGAPTNLDFYVTGTFKR